MRIDLTVRTDTGDRDFAITAAGPVAVRDLRSDLARLAGLPADRPLWSGDQPLPESAVLGGAGLRPAAVLGAGGPQRCGPQPGVLGLHHVGGRGAGRVFPLGRGRLVLGRGAECDVVLADADVSRRHAVVEVSGDGVTVCDLGSTNGTRIDGRPVVGTHPVRAGQVIRLGDCSLTVAGPTHVPAAVSPASDGTVRLVRPPRPVPHPAGREIELPRQPDSARPRGVQWVAALLPAAAGGALAWFAHSPQFLLFVLLSPLMMLSTSLGDRLHWSRSRRRAAAEHARRSGAAAREIAAGLEAETRARRAALPDAADILRTASLPGSRLWERRRNDADFLLLRVGTADLESLLRVRDGTQVRAAGTVAAVPVVASLRDGPLGIATPDDVRAGLGRWLLAQLCCAHSPADLSVSVLVSPERAAQWAWARWLPHLGGRVAVGAAEAAGVVGDLAGIVGERAARRATPDERPGPAHVLVVDGAGSLADVPGLAGLLDQAPAVGVSALCLDADVAALPSACRSVVRATGETGNRASVRPAGGSEQPDVVLDTVDPAWAETVARRLAPLVDAGADGTAAVPGSADLLAALGIDSPAGGIDAAVLAQRWAAAPAGAATVIGAGPDGPLRLDLVADGPHALIAGTTGAGKSELLQTLVVGLAANHAPDDLTVLLIDYKGGAAFADCARLPHAAGLVTDLDTHLTARALRSLHSELRRRERLLGRCGATDLAGYRAARAADPELPGLPRLVIVVDELAALAQELPDFVRGLVGVAQRGRSLGLHLVLATQRPGSAVSPEIRANTSLRIALRVTDAGDSSDVIDAPDAAAVERGTPGRGYLRSGAGLTCFQAAYGGRPAVCSDGALVEALGPWRRPADGGRGGATTTALADLVDAIDKAAAANGAAPARSPWQPPLPDELLRGDLDTTGDSDGALVLGLVDRPDDQCREPFELDVGRGASLLVAGAGRSGRSGTLVTAALAAAERFGPEALSLYVVAATGTVDRTLGALPHCATTLGADELADVPTLLQRLTDTVRRNVDADRVLLLVDGWDALAAALGDAQAAECADLLAGLVRIGPAARLSVVVTGDRTVLAPRFAGGFGAKLVLRMGDRNDFGAASIASRDVPERLGPGRGLRGEDAALVQIAWAGDRHGEVAALTARWAGHRPHPGAVRLRPLPAVITRADVTAAADAADAADAGDAGLVLGVGGDDARPIVVDLFRGTGRLLVAGPPRSGRSTLLCSIVEQAAATGTPVVVAGPARSPVRAAALASGVRVVDPAADAAAVGDAPTVATLLVVDDCEAFADTAAGDALTEWLRRADGPLAAVVAGRADDLATSYRGLGAQVRRAHTGLLLRPGPVDGEILGIRLARRSAGGPAGRGVLVGDPAWGAVFEAGDPVPIQVARP